MPTTFPFSEDRIKKLKPPTDKDREYHKDKTVRGLQVCVTATGSKNYYYVRRMDGRPTRLKLGSADVLSVADARSAAQEQAGKVAAGENPQVARRLKREEPTLDQLHAHWMIYAKAHKKSWKEDQRIYDTLLKPLATRRLGSITKANVQALHGKIGKSSGIYAANRALALLSSMYNAADEIGYRGDNPAKGVKKFAEVQRDRFLQADEFKAFFAALDSEPEIFRDYFRLALLTGARKSNLLSMRWTDINLPAGLWRIPETKNGSVVVVPLVEPAVEILQRRSESAGGQWVFPGQRRGGHLTEPDKAWERIRTAANLPDLHIHDLRRSLGSWMAGQNTSTIVIGKVLGHRPGSPATSVYARLAVDPQRQAMEAATTAMLTAGKQTDLLTVDVEAEEETRET